MFLTNFLLLVLSLKITECEFPKIFWTYWGKGLQSHLTIKMYHDNHRQMIEKNGWQVRFVNDITVQKYLKQAPLYSEQQYRSLKNILAPPAMSDYIRCTLISHYGGVYLDMSSIMLQDLSWLNFDNLRNNPHVLNRYGDSPEVLFFTYHDYGQEQKYFDSSQNQSFIVKPTYEIWFIAAVPNSKFFLQYCPQLAGVYLDGGTGVDGYKRYKQRMIKEEQIGDDVIKLSAYLVSLDIVNVQLVKRQRMLDKITKQKNQSRQLAAWYYKAWHIPAQKGPYSLLYYYGYYYLTLTAHFSQQQIQRIYKLQNIRYLIKGVSWTRDQMQNFFINLPFYDIKRKWKCYFYQQTHCTVYKNSLLYKYLINGSQYQQLFRVLNKQFIKIDSNTSLKENNKVDQIAIFFSSVISLLLTVIMILLAKLRRQRDEQQTIKRIKINESEQLEHQTQKIESI